MGLQGEKKLEDILTGALIGLARTTYSHLKTENTDRVVTCALSVLVRVDADEKELEKQLEQVRAEKLAVAPGCATCVAKCGNTDDYDMDRFWNGPVQVRSLKIRLFSGYHGCCLQRTFYPGRGLGTGENTPGYRRNGCCRDHSKRTAVNSICKSKALEKF